MDEPAAAKRNGLGFTKTKRWEGSDGVKKLVKTDGAKSSLYRASFPVRDERSSWFSSSTGLECKSEVAVVPDRGDAVGFDLNRARRDKGTQKGERSGTSGRPKKGFGCSWGEPLPRHSRSSGPWTEGEGCRGTSWDPWELWVSWSPYSFLVFSRLTMAKKRMLFSSLASPK